MDVVRLTEQERLDLIAALADALAEDGNRKHPSPEQYKRWELLHHRFEYGAIPD